MSDNLPDEVDFITSTLPYGSAAELRNITCNIGDLAVNESVTFTIKTAVHTDVVADAGQPTTITNTASVLSGGAVDADTSNNSTDAVTIVEDLADLRVTKECKPDEPLPAGETGTCTIFVDNLGPSDARNVVLTDVHLSDGSFTIGTVTPGSCSEAAGTVTCNLGVIPAGGRVIVTVPITASEAMDINDIATVLSDTPDPDFSNNEARESISVSALADLAITKADNPDPAVAGTDITYTLTVTNNGPSTAVNVVVKDVLPAGVKHRLGIRHRWCDLQCRRPGRSVPAHDVRLRFDG